MRDTTDEDDEEKVEEEQPFYLKGFNSIEWRKKYKLKHPDWRFDTVPEIMDGINIADFIDPDIMKKLEELEKEEEEREAKLAMEEDDDSDLVALTEDQLELVQQIREKKAMIKLNHEMLGGKADRPTVPKKYNKNLDQNVDKFEKELTGLGIDAAKAVDRLRSRSRDQTEKREARKRTRSVDAMETETNDDSMETEEKSRERAKKILRIKSSSRSRSRSKTPAEEGLKDIAQKIKVTKMAQKVQKIIGKDARRGESDRHVFDLKPKHLLAGKRKAGKTDRR